MNNTAAGVSIEADLGFVQLLPQRHHLLAMCPINPFALRHLLLCSLAATLHSRLCGGNTVLQLDCYAAESL